jgi:hypothetical protein
MFDSPRQEKLKTSTLEMKKKRQAELLKEKMKELNLGAEVDAIGRRKLAQEALIQQTLENPEKKK